MILIEIDLCQWCTGWLRPIRSPKMQIISHKRVTKYRSLLPKMTYNDEVCYESSPSCTPFPAHAAYPDSLTMHRVLKHLFTYKDKDVRYQRHSYTNLQTQHVYALPEALINKHTNVHMYTHTQLCTHLCIETYTHVYIYLHAHTHLCIHTFMYSHKCICTHAHSQRLHRPPRDVQTGLRQVPRLQDPLWYIVRACVFACTCGCVYVCLHSRAHMCVHELSES